MFKSNALESLTRVHPTVAILYNLTCSSSLLYINYHFGFVAGIGKILGIFFIGYVSWTVAEYLLHRFFFHITTDKHPFLGKISHTVHGVHHEQPSDFKRMFMPPVPATIFMAVFFGVFYLLLNTKVFVFLPGFLFGYLSYAYTHFKVHQSKAPKKLKWLWIHHLKHHYQDETKAYGVSSPFWDLIFRTMPSKVAVKVSKEVQQKEPGLIDDEEQEG
ncbi:MAG: hypothetical protein S4CHLAM6_04710 [Chlamydiae bacterium]|nr:hypothetical protein [Chlamydiota bacterium]